MMDKLKQLTQRWSTVSLFWDECTDTWILGVDCCRVADCRWQIRTDGDDLTLEQAMDIALNIKNIMHKATYTIDGNKE